MDEVTQRWLQHLSQSSSSDLNISILLQLIKRKFLHTSLNIRVPEIAEKVDRRAEAPRPLGMEGSLGIAVAVLKTEARI